MEMRWKVYNGGEVIFTAVADLPEVVDTEFLVEFERVAIERFRQQYPFVILPDPRIRWEWEKEGGGRGR